MTQRNRSRKKTWNLFARVIKQSLLIQEPLKVSQWAEKHRVLDESSNLAGKWSNSVTPYLVGIWIPLTIHIFGKRICVKGPSLAEQRQSSIPLDTSLRRNRALL